MNFHSDEWVMEKMNEHYQDALKHFPEDRIVGLFCQGSTNYGLDTVFSDVDTKLVVVPTFEDVAMNRQPVSTTFVRENNEHIDFKDLRLMLQTFKKQNLNFLEILFTPYKIINPMYEESWNKLVAAAEQIAHYNVYAAVRAMKGVALEKYHAMEHRYPAKAAILDKLGYDPKQLHHLMRVEDYLERYIKGKSYASCLKPIAADFLKEVKLGWFTLEEARKQANKSLAHIEQMCEPFTKASKYNKSDKEVDKLLYDVQLEIMRTALAKGFLSCE